MANKIIEDLEKPERYILDLEAWLCVHYPNVLQEYEVLKSKNLILE